MVNFMKFSWLENFTEINFIKIFTLKFFKNFTELNFSNYIVVYFYTGHNPMWWPAVYAFFIKIILQKCNFCAASVD